MEPDGRHYASMPQATDRRCSSSQRADLTKMQVVANLDESDVGRIRPNQTVSFRVDAYPNEMFIGDEVSQVRLEPKVNQNVVTYATVIDVPNNDLKLKPGMTANVNVEIAKSSNVLRIPNSALRFRPTNEMYAAIGQTPPEPPQRGDGGTRRVGPQARLVARPLRGTPHGLRRPTRRRPAAPPAGSACGHAFRTVPTASAAPAQGTAPKGPQTMAANGGGENDSAPSASHWPRRQPDRSGTVRSHRRRSRLRSGAAAATAIPARRT